MKRKKSLNNLTFHLKKLEKHRQTEHEASRRKELNDYIRDKYNWKQQNNSEDQWNQMFFFLKFKNIDMFLIDWPRENNPVTKIGNVSEDITT